MENYKIGIKLADGSFYPILEEGKPQSQKIELTTVRDDQTTVQLDLYRSSYDNMEDAEYVDTLLVENLLCVADGFHCVLGVVVCAYHFGVFGS